MNGYFQLTSVEQGDRGTYIIIYPPSDVEHGQRVKLDDVQRYLQELKISEYDLVALNTMIATCLQPAKMKLTSEVILPQPEKAVVTIAIDKMSAYLKFYAPSPNGRKCVIEDVHAAIRKANIKYGVSQQAVEKVFAAHEYCTEYKIAVGMVPVQGKAASIRYMFETNTHAKPKMLEDGTVDFHSLDLIKHVTEGDLLAELTPADFGKPGLDVCGTVKKPQKVENMILRFGKNITLSEDKLKIFSDVSGHVKLDQDGKVNVYNVYEVAGDVDLNTGDVAFNGDVIVKGAVRTGFKVEATGNISVNGPVEGAGIYAGGNIVLQRGIQGMNKGVLSAGGNIIAKFIESSDIKSGGFIQSEAILHSQVQAKTEIIVDGKKGMITGGDIKAGSKIMSKILGSNMGTTTSLEVGIDPQIAEAHMEATKALQTAEKELPQVEKMIALISKQLKQGMKVGPEKVQHLKDAVVKKKELDAIIEELTPKITEYEEELEQKSNGKISVYASVYPGVKLSIGNIKRFIQEEIKYSTFIRDGADIKAKAYSK